MFERFNETARRTLFFARYETSELGGAAVEAEHMLLGLLRADTGPTPRAFAVANLAYTAARAEIRAHWGVRRHVPVSEEVPFAEQTQRILGYATEEADRLGDEDIGAEHLLLGLLREDSFAAVLLGNHGITIEGLRKHLGEQPVVRGPEPEAVEPFDAVMAVERIRVLAEEMCSRPHDADRHSLVDEIHVHLDALKQHLAR